MVTTTSTHLTSSAPSLDALALSRALRALSAKLLTPSPSPALQHSSYERTKTSTNLEYARTLLLRVEHATAKERIQSRKQAQQSKLAEQRAVVKQLTDRLYELGEQDKDTVRNANGAGYGQQQAQEQAPDPMILALIGDSETAKDTSNVNTQDVSDENATNGDRGPISDAQFASSPSPAYTESTSQLRSRRALLGPQSTTTGSSVPTPTLPNSSSAPAPGSAKLLEAADSTHAQLTSSLLSLATALKESAARFQDDLAADAEAMGRSEQALGKNVDGLDAATAKMGLLSKMGEGRWWWGRMVLYAMIGGLWMFSLLLVFIGPKIRF